jgi:hypothetical protein
LRTLRPPLAKVNGDQISTALEDEEEVEPEEIEGMGYRIKKVRTVKQHTAKGEEDAEDVVQQEVNIWLYDKRVMP